MINSYLHEIIPLKSVKNPLSDKACAPRLNLEKKLKTISSTLINNEYFLEFKRQWYKHLNPTCTVCTWQQGCQKVLSSRQIIVNSSRLWNSHQGTSSWGPWHLATLWNLESRKWHFQGFSRGTLHHRGCHVVSSEYAQDWEQCRRKDCRNVPGALFERFTGLNQFKNAFNVNQNWETDERGFAWHRILPNSQFQKRDSTTKGVSVRSKKVLLLE